MNYTELKKACGYFNKNYFIEFNMFSEMKMLEFAHTIVTCSKEIENLGGDLNEMDFEKVKVFLDTLDRTYASYRSMDRLNPEGRHINPWQRFFESVNGKPDVLCHMKIQSMNFDEKLKEINYGIENRIDF